VCNALSFHSTPVEPTRLLQKRVSHVRQNWVASSVVGVEDSLTEALPRDPHAQSPRQKKVLLNLTRMLGCLEILPLKTLVWTSWLGILI
jgi:hypothetical protein